MEQSRVQHETVEGLDLGDSLVLKGPNKISEACLQTELEELHFRRLHTESYHDTKRNRCNGSHCKQNVTWVTESMFTPTFDFCVRK